MGNRKTLLLNSSFEVLNFITYKKAFKLLFKENKVEVIATYDDVIIWGAGKIKHPAILRLKNHVRRNYFNSNFSRKALIKRDRSCCMYCGLKLSSSQITIDHVLPRAQGGTTSFTNCVVSCMPCNNKKGSNTPEQAGMKLLRKPTHPSFNSRSHTSADVEGEWFVGWDDFLQ